MARHLPLPERVVREALALVSEHGIAHLSIREVARRLRVSHQAPYKLFPTRDHLVAEMASRSFRRFAAFLDGRPIENDPMRDMRALGERYLEFATQHPLDYELMFATPLPEPSAFPEMLREARHTFDVLVRCLRREARARGKEPDAERAASDALFVWTTMHGLASALRADAFRALDLSPAVVARAADVTCRRIELALQADTPRPATRASRTRAPSKRRRAE